MNAWSIIVDDVLQYSVQDRPLRIRLRLTHVPTFDDECHPEWDLRQLHVKILRQIILPQASSAA
jgi:hypothetical protein